MNIIYKENRAYEEENDSFVAASFFSSHFLLAVYGRDSQKEQSRVVVIAIDGLRWQEVFELIGHTSDLPTHHISSPTVAYRCRVAM